MKRNPWVSQVDEPRWPRPTWRGVEFDFYIDSSLWRRKIFSLGLRVNFFPRREGRGWLLHAHVVLGFWLFAFGAEPLRSHPGDYS